MLSRQNGAGVEALVPFFASFSLFLLAMLIFLAESKTMSTQQFTVTESSYQAHLPVMESFADEIMRRMESLSPDQIAEILGISNQLAIKAHNLAYDFPNKFAGYKALHGFTGEAYRSLDASSLNQEALDFADKNLKIVSSVYGILSSSDIIKPYRCEFNKPIGLNHLTSIQIFKPKITIEVVKKIKEEKIKEIINLLPGDAEKCIDWKIIKAFAKVYKICFQNLGPGDKLKTPLAGKLKELRGLMARDILMNNISDFRDLIQLESNRYIYSPEHSKPGLPVFIAD